MCAIKQLITGQKFIYQNNTYLKLPDHVTCYNQPANAVNIDNGMLIYIANTTKVKLI